MDGVCVSVVLGVIGGSDVGSDAKAKNLIKFFVQMRMYCGGAGFICYLWLCAAFVWCCFSGMQFGTSYAGDETFYGIGDRLLVLMSR